MPQTTAYRSTPTNPTTTTASSAQSGAVTIEHTDEFLDEVDAVLEENALEVVRSYVQRPGQ
jgi:ubiquitin-like protein Pup